MKGSTASGSASSTCRISWAFPADFTHPKFQKAVDRVLAAARKHGCGGRLHGHRRGWREAVFREGIQSDRLVWILRCFRRASARASGVAAAPAVTGPVSRKRRRPIMNGSGTLDSRLHSAAGKLAQCRLQRSPWMHCQRIFARWTRPRPMPCRRFCTPGWPLHSGPVTGHKIGCTTAVMQTFLRIPNPCAGGVFERTVHRSPARGWARRFRAGGGRVRDRRQAQGGRSLYKWVRGSGSEE